MQEIHRMSMADNYKFSVVFVIQYFSDKSSFLKIASKKKSWYNDVLTGLYIFFIILIFLIKKVNFGIWILKNEM